ncbi:MAG TPA: hypothetical protein VGP79_18325 [Bryobacteraceae bacterium]|nr:hypothetical protein [Bryobacteraceae bacterium]
MSDFSSGPSSKLPARPSMEQLRKQAKDRLRALRLAEPDRTITLAEVQFELARECGFDTWAKLKEHIEDGQPSRVELLERLARDLVDACHGDSTALDRLNEVYGNSFRRASNPYSMELLHAKVQEILDAVSSSSPLAAELTEPDARMIVARRQGFESWSKLIESVSKSPAVGARPASAFYGIDWKTNTLSVGTVLSDKDWDAIVAVMKEHRITALRAEGRMTDAALERVCGLDHITRLDLGGSLQLTDDGLAHLAKLPGLRELDLSGWKGQITDRGLDALRQLPELRRFQMCWQQHITDAGVANLAASDHLESVNLMGTPAGDGAISALSGKPSLRKFHTGREVTDAGLGLLHSFPAFKTWQGGEIMYGLMGFDAGPTFLLVDGPFSDAGLARLAGLDGLFGLTFFWHCPAFTSAGLEPLKDLPNLGFIGCQDQHCDDEAMRHIAAIPRLRMLMGQGAVATDAGWAALSRSQTIEHIWGRECPNLTGRGFAALAAMPSLRGLAVSCKGVDDAALATLPQFPALRQLMPMDVSDDGFRHVGHCAELDALWCMYCRDTGDAATEHLAGLTKLKTYYAGKTKITDRSLEILGELDSLEKLEFWECAGITNVGVAHLAGLPRLREIEFGASPGVTREAVALFSPSVRVSYWAS